MEFMLIQVDDISADIVQEALVVRYDEERFLPSLKIAVGQKYISVVPYCALQRDA